MTHYIDIALTDTEMKIIKARTTKAALKMARFIAESWVPDQRHELPEVLESFAEEAGLETVGLERLLYGDLESAWRQIHDVAQESYDEADAA